MDQLFRIIGFDAQLIFDAIITGINVFILFFALSYFLFNPIQKALRDRNEKIKNELSNAKKNEEDANKLKLEYEEKLANARVEVEMMMETAKKNAKSMADSIVADAHTEAQKIKERANKEIEQEKLKAVSELKDKVIDISTLLAAKVVRKNVNADDAKAFFNETLEEIGDTTWQD